MLIHVNSDNTSIVVSWKKYQHHLQAIMVDGTWYIFLLIRLLLRLLRAASGSRRTLFKLNGSRAIRRRFLENLAEETTSETTVSYFPFFLSSEKLECFESRVDRKPRAFLRTEDRLSLFGFRVSKAPDLDAEKGKLSRSLVVLSFMYYKNGVIHCFKETTVAESCPRNFERKPSS